MFFSGKLAWDLPCVAFKRLPSRLLLVEPRLPFFERRSHQGRRPQVLRGLARLRLMQTLWYPFRHRAPRRDRMKACKSNHREPRYRSAYLEPVEVVKAHPGTRLVSFEQPLHLGSGGVHLLAQQGEVVGVLRREGRGREIWLELHLGNSLHFFYRNSSSGAPLGWRCFVVFAWFWSVRVVV